MRGVILLIWLSCMITYLLTSQLFPMYCLSLARRALLRSSSVRTGINNQASLSTWSLPPPDICFHTGIMCLN